MSGMAVFEEFSAVRSEIFLKGRDKKSSSEGNYDPMTMVDEEQFSYKAREVTKFE